MSAISVSMTAVNSFLTIFTIPIIVNVALGFFLGKSSTLEMPFWNTVLQILLITVIPCVVGILIRAQNEAFTRRVERPLKIAMRPNESSLGATTPCTSRKEHVVSRSSHI